ncbi:LLM class flavin-dependent oxidoreductase (plasmid) [Streptomyces globisporus]|uniref:LLM class flavin-dependent oxidoreductase n=1 Tax=Streptomyces globisporus TaxID=1908 RepID=UPI002F91AE81|nr:LLM class flavin-dependent oxidoreductase [Streptomyces globisporus]
MTRIRPGPAPDGYRRFLDPIAILSVLAHATERVSASVRARSTPRIYSPVLLARSLASVDILSGGRLQRGPGARLVVGRVPRNRRPVEGARGAS